MNRTDVIFHVSTRIFPLIILPLATIGNSLCFLVFCRDKFQKRLTRTSSICIRLLCLNDSLLLYLFVVDVLLKGFFGSSTRIYWSPLTCRLYKWIRYSLSDFSAYLQLGLSTDRFICCVHPAYYSRWRKRTYLFYLLLTAFTLIIMKNGSFLSTNYGYVLAKNNQTTLRCSVNKNATSFMIYMTYSQSVIDLIFITCLPFSLILYFNSRILREVLRLRNECWSALTRLMNLSTRQSETSVSTSNGHPTNFNSTPTTNTIGNSNRARHRRLHLTFALGCISFVFIFGTAPYKIFKIIERHDKLLRDKQQGDAKKSLDIQLAEVIIDCFVFLSCSTPFFVCFATSSMFREELRRMFR